jgi:predicted nucleotidyltransferase
MRAFESPQASSGRPPFCPDEVNPSRRRDAARPAADIIHRMAVGSIPDVPNERLREFAERWKIDQLALFGSAARGELTAESDIDIAVTFSPEAQWSLFDFASMQLELSRLFGRDVDLIEKSRIKNPFRRRSVLRDLTVLYAA